MAYFMTIGHGWVLEAKIGLTFAILAKNGSKMTIFTPLRAFELGYKISTKNLIEGLIIVKICDFGL